LYLPKRRHAVPNSRKLAKGVVIGVLAWLDKNHTQHRPWKDDFPVLPDLLHRGQAAALNLRKPDQLPAQARSLTGCGLHFH
jgi:hypothetical protein